MNTPSNPSKGLNITLWVAQAVLGAILILAAFMKLTFPAEKLAEMWPWTGAYPTLAKFTGVIDGLAGLGLLLPGTLKLLPRLTFYAAAGIVLLMVAAIIFHFTRGEGALTGFNFFVLAIAVFIALGRKKPGHS